MPPKKKHASSAGNKESSKGNQSKQKQPAQPVPPPDDEDWQNKRKSLVNSNRYILETGTNSDVEFLVGPQLERIVAHKLILSNRSGVFQSMFFGDLAERGREIPLPDAEVDGFRKFLK